MSVSSKTLMIVVSGAQLHVILILNQMLTSDSVSVIKDHSVPRFHLNGQHFPAFFY